MDKLNAIRLLDETFKKDFDIQRYERFVKELFNNFNMKQKSLLVWNEYQDYIKSFLHLGSYMDNSKNVVDVLVVELGRTSSRDRARTMQRNFVAKYLRNTGKDAALVAFHGGDEDWRFSFVKIEYIRIKDEEGKTKIEEEFTPAKRYSFLVGKNEPNHTCESQFLKLIMEDEINPSLEEIETAFSVDNVTKEFFREYKNLFLNLKEELDKIKGTDKNIKREFEEKNISTVDFSKKLLGQIVFVYFLQKKGWLGVAKEDDGKFKEWGTGPRNFLSKLYKKEIVEYENFFNDILEPLFYKALATERDDDYYSRFRCKIPFLNGGLFEPINDYDWAGTEITLSNQIFDRILTTFDRFNFTVKEDEPLDKEVAVDPEMLGKVFENLLEVKDRKSKGAFYTPREIVHYMCQQSLINYLMTNTSILREDIENFVLLGDLVLGQIINEQEQIKKYGKSYDVNKRYVIPKSIGENYLLIDKLLTEIKIVDPAVGSGAFLVGMMNEIVKSKSILNIFLKNERKNYDLKREIIENCLYGVDIEPSAIEITKLRFWLSLIVDELGMENIKPLPNLDHKIMCGNSLLEEFEGVKLFDERLLGEVKKDYSFEIAQIDNKITELRKEKGEIALGKKNDKKIKDIEKEIKKLMKIKEEFLAGPKQEIQQTTLEDSLQIRIKESRKKLAELKKLQKEYFSEQNRKIKKRLREDIDRIEWELIEETLKEQGNEKAMQKLKQYNENKSKPFFLWKLYFAEVFQRKNPGFDVVIANPPYLKFDEIRLKDTNFRVYRDGYGMKYKFNLYSLFSKKGALILREKGVMSYIVPNSFSKEKYNEDIREDYIKNNKIISFVDFTQEKNPVFESGSNDSYIVFVLQKKKEMNDKIIINKYLDKRFTFSHFIKQEDLAKSFDYQFNIMRDNLLLHKIEKNAIELGRICMIRVGLTPSRSYKKRYGKDYENFLKKYASKKNLYPFLKRNKLVDICDRYRIKHKTDFIIWDRDKLYKDKVCPGELEDYKNNKLIFRNRGVNLFGSYDNKNIVVNDIFNVLVLKSSYVKDRKGEFLDEDIKLSSQFSLKYILSIINSKLINYYLNNKFVFRDIKAPMMKLFPIKKISSSEQKPLIQLVDQILSITKDDDYLNNPNKQAKVKQLEKEIDQLVYELYELTPQEIEIVENSGKEKLVKN
jgi:hypothetical protein